MHCKSLWIKASVKCINVNVYVSHLHWLSLSLSLSLCVCLQLLEFDRELSVFKERLHELDISFPPRYEHDEHISSHLQISSLMSAETRRWNA